MPPRPTADRAATRRETSRQIRDFLRTRRARVTPAEAGLPPGLTRRRVAGLRREEVALLAGISVEYYAKLERGTIVGVSPGILDAIATVLHLDDVERAYLIGLFRQVGGNLPEWPDAPTRVRAELQRLIDRMPGAGVFVRNGRLDVLAANSLGRALYCEVLSDRSAPDVGKPPNLARYLFLDDRSRTFYVNWTRQATAAVGSLRAQSGRTPNDPDLRSLVADLGRRSEEFRSRWAGHDVEYYRAGTQPFSHPRAGRLDLYFEALEVAADPGLTVVAYSATPGSASDAALAGLGEAQR